MFNEVKQRLAKLIKIRQHYNLALVGLCSVFVLSVSYTRASLAYGYS